MWGCDLCDVGMGVGWGYIHIVPTHIIQMNVWLYPHPHPHPHRHQVFGLLRYMHKMLPQPRMFERAVSMVVSAALLAVGGSLVVLMAAGKVCV